MHIVFKLQQEHLDTYLVGHQRRADQLGATLRVSSPGPLLDVRDFDFSFAFPDGTPFFAGRARVASVGLDGALDLVFERLDIAGRELLAELVDQRDAVDEFDNEPTWTDVPEIARPGAESQDDLWQDPTVVLERGWLADDPEGYTRRLLDETARMARRIVGS